MHEAVHAAYAKDAHAASSEESDAIEQHADEIDTPALTDADINALARIATNEERITGEPLRAESATGSIQQANENDAQAARPGSSGTEAAARPGSAAGEEGFGLTGETAAEAPARVAGEEKAAADKAKAEKDAVSTERAR